MVDMSRPPLGKGNMMDNLKVSPWGVRHSCELTRSIHRPGLLNRLINGALSDALSDQLLGESFFSHIQTSMSEMFRVPSDSLRIGSGGRWLRDLCYHKDTLNSTK
jgi:hypothetical protein